MKVVLSTVLGLLALGLVNLAPARAAVPPVSAFARLPAIEQAVISPDGSRIALLGGPPGERTIFLAPVDGQQAVTVKLGQAWVRSLRWVSDDYLIVNFSMLDKGTDYSSGREWAYALNRNVVISKEGKLVASLLANTEWSRYAVSQPVLGVIDGPRPSALILGLDLSLGVRTGGAGTLIQPTADEMTWVLWRVDVATGDASIAEKGGPYTQSWDLDASGQPRLRWDYDGDLELNTYYGRPKGRAAWSKIALADENGGELEILGYSDPDDSVYLVGQEGAEVRLFRCGLATGETTPVTLDKASRDLSLTWDPYRIAPVAVVTEAERPSHQWLDPDLGKVQAKLARAFAGRDVELVSWSKDRGRVVIRVTSPASPPSFFLFDARSNQASSLGEAYPELAEAAFGSTTWLTYKARDGLEIAAYLTLPPGHVEGTKPPLIVMPHGGPAARDHFEFDWWAQALATRGYAVLQPQFRGSAGFGAAFQRAGYRQWGGKMQEDLIDGVMAMAGKGVIDPARVCIVGASYGGYAALFGATVYPSAYRCAVSVNGVSDLGLFYGSKSRAYGRDAALVNSLITMMGDPRNDAEAYRLASPVSRVTSRTAPILLIHGENDTTVPIQQSRSMQRALKAIGKPSDLVVLEADDHHLSSTASRTKMLESLFAFLDRHLPVAP
ncbi:MAG: S9 family peptidase [Caulobacter sp.]|nr:S9 family peptidase [Caulobacter sp.]